MRVVVRTGRLVLRQLERSDTENLWSLDGDPDVMRHICLPTVSRAEFESTVVPALLAERERYRQFGYWAAETKDGEFVGRFGLHPSTPTENGLWEHTASDHTSLVTLGYRIRRSAWGRGYATEGSRALVDRAFAELGVAEMRATTMAVNVGSRRVLEKVGFEHTRTVHLEWPDPLEGNELGDVIYRLDEERWRRLRSSGGRPVWSPARPDQRR
jgi:RimJ/RimL family protein N-acetyltransferase